MTIDPPVAPTDRRAFLVGAASLAVLAACSDDGNDGGAAGDASGDADSDTDGQPAGSSGGGALSLPAAFTPVLFATVGVESAPVEATDGRWRVLYELILTNARPAPATVESIEVVDGNDLDRVVATFAGDSLQARLRALSTRPVDDTVLGPDVSRLMYVDIAFDSIDDVPDVVAQRFVGQAAANPGTDQPSPVDYYAAPFGLADRTAATIGAPLRGAGWVAINGLETGVGVHRYAGVHRGSVQSVDGELFGAQRFAIDWMLLGADDTFASGDPTDVNNWHCYGAEVLAVADGIVVEVLDELPDQVPGSLPDPGDITLETVDGNHVILDLGNGVHAFYAHLQPGSVAVAEGDSVSAGDVIGLLGNSGNTSAPHLHLHLMTSPSALGADSIPYGFDRFRTSGRIDLEDWEAAEDIVGPWAIVDAEQVEHEDRLPLGLVVVDFADET